jgi:dTDP-4-dehydrorhamnose reductase
VKLLVTGASGMLGHDVVRAAELTDREVVALERADLDVMDAAAVRRAVERARPDAVVNCAAWTDVDGAETAEDEALALNAEAAGHVAAAAAAVDAAVVYPSTDYVFDGTLDRPYVESDPTNPLSAYGRTKLAGERATAAANERHLVVRTSWLFGVGGRNFVETMLSLAPGGEVRVVTDQVGSPTYTAQLAHALLRLAATDAHGVHHAAATGRCSWLEFAEAIFAGAGVTCDVRPTTSAGFARPAPRPAWSVLASERDDGVTLPHWQAGLDGYLAERTVETTL